MSNRWTERVEQYVLRLQETREAIDEILDQTRVDTVSVRSEEVEKCQQKLAAMIEQLEQLVHEREELLNADDAPARGLTLTEKLLSTHHIEDARLAKHCGVVSEAVEMTHQRAMSLFVCQFHLANLGSDLLQLLSGSLDAGTYGNDRPKLGNGGGLFNDAA